jgi:hypothetical protein
LGYKPSLRFKKVLENLSPFSPKQPKSIPGKDLSQGEIQKKRGKEGERLKVIPQYRYTTVTPLGVTVIF